MFRSPYTLENPVRIHEKHRPLLHGDYESANRYHWLFRVVLNQAEEGIVKTIGLLGGMSWESTRSYYQAINDSHSCAQGGRMGVGLNPIRHGLPGKVEKHIEYRA